MGSSSSLVGNLEKELECSICLSIYTNPKTLPCLHTFCCDCLNELAEKSRENRQQIACPECRARIDLPHGSSFDNFPTACYLNRLKDIVSVQRQENQGLGGTINRKNNDLRHIEEAAEAAKSRLKESEAKIQERADVLKKQANKDDDTRRRIRQQIKQTREAIQRSSQILMQLVKKHEEQLMTEVDAFEEDAEKKFEDQTENLELHQGRLNSIAEYSRSARSRGNSEVLEAEASAMSRTQEVFDALSYQPLETVCVEYKPNEDVPRHLENSPLGRVYSGLADPQKTQIQGLEKKRNYENCWAQIASNTEALYSDVTVRVRGQSSISSPLDTHVAKRRPRWYKAVATFGSRGSGKGQFRLAYGIAVNRAGEVAVSDITIHRVQIFSADGQYLREFGTQGTADGQFDTPGSLAYNRAGHIVVADARNSRIQVFSRSGRWISKFGQGVLRYPGDVSVTSDDNIVVCDEKTVNVFSPEGVLLLQFSTGITLSCAIFSDQKYFCGPLNDLDSCMIKVFDSRGSHLYDIDHRNDFPVGLAVNTDDLLLISNQRNNHVQVVTLDGEFVTAFGSCLSGSGLKDIAVSPDGRVFVIDSYNDRVQVFQAQY